MIETPATPALERLRGMLYEIADLQHAEMLLDWDSRVSMPHGGALARAEASATVGRLAHEKFVSDEIGTLIEELTPLETELGHDSAEAALVRVTRREWERNRRVPSALAGELVRAAAVAVAAWDEAKAASDFAAFAPHLERMLELKRKYIACFPDTADPYDVLLDEYEEGMTTTRVDAVFAELKEFLLPLAERGSKTDDAEFLHGPFSKAGQIEAAWHILAAFGATPENWRLDETPHPFASQPGLGDTRLTTRYEEHNLQGLFATMHEFGHGIYEFRIDPAFARTPLAAGTSAAFHESQSRTWENLVGRSRGFWHWFYPQLQTIFPALQPVDEDDFVRATNAVSPSPLRGDADEATYGLHIILRYELERELLSGALPIAELPEAWNARVQEYLGVEVPDDAHGVLQDTHWAIGLLGYFPTYELGNVISVQIWNRAVQDLGDVEAQFARGDFAPLREWLAEHVYRCGSMYPPDELLRRITGSSLDPQPYIAYLKAKFE